MVKKIVTHEKLQRRYYKANSSSHDIVDLTNSKVFKEGIND